MVASALGPPPDAALVTLAKGRVGKAIALRAQGLDSKVLDLGSAQAKVTRGQSAVLLSQLYEKLGGEPYERLAGVLELACEWACGAGVEGANETWAEAWSALETLRQEAEGLDMDPKHALARAVGILDRAAAAKAR